MTVGPVTAGTGNAGPGQAGTGPGTGPGTVSPGTASPGTASPVTPGLAARLGGRAGAALAVSVVLVVLVGLLGPSEVTVALGGAVRGRPPYDLGVSPPPWVAVWTTVLALLLGAGGVVLALRAMAAGWCPSPRRWLAGGAAAVLGFLAVPPAASGDALVYAAYGRLAALGADPYLVTPRALIADGDPVGVATERPWQGVTSVYGPLATGVQEVASRLAGGSMQQTVWWLSVANALAWIASGVLLLALAAGDTRARSRVLVLYWANPLLLWAVPFGGHNDVQALAFAVGALLALRQRSVVLGAAVSGALIGLAGAVKLTEGIVGLGLLWAVRRRPVAAVALCASAAAVLALAYVPHLPEALAQTSDNSGFVSSASPWRWVRALLDVGLTGSLSRGLVTALAWGVVLVVAALLGRRVLRPGSATTGTGTTGAAPTGAAPTGSVTTGGDATGRDRVLDASRAVVAVTLAWTVLGSYTLPWYDMVVWAPIALVGPSTLDLLLLVRATTVCLAYVATREVPADQAPSRALAFVADRFRDTISPLVHVALAVALVRWSRGRDGGDLLPRLTRTGRSRPALPGPVEPG